MTPVWLLPPTDLQLFNHDVHLWRAQLELSELLIEKLATTLSEDEQQRAERFYFERDRKHFIAGRGLLRQILGRYLGMNPRQVEFCYGKRGKPALKETCGGKRLRFNVSHSHGLILYAITQDQRIGVDLEYLRPMPDAEQLAQRFFSPQEYAVICSVSEEQKHKAFFQGWTSKEAYLKAIGEGLAGLEQVEVSVNPAEPTALLSINKDPQAVYRWSIAGLTPAPGYFASLVVERKDWQLSCFDYTEKSVSGWGVG
ncbi:4'-phosphopantetheinyl transferase superfamily protein [Moorena producens JHB]|uniref:4'-phosphopantetheinyl transferase superfamily protein n=1 Tax=Moorena producens (strain JHB) TaxID=1454205 RepID=A0A1D9G605_MOOP1|nr:4'-phosphopantetheinyl transferase superfamily protein [Moorena producens]AOY82850.1 4'-phosphopantetheinyl transferase superfamily protein [Moorena producens JHB]